MAMGAMYSQFAKKVYVSAVAALFSENSSIEKEDDGA
jgi:hypothetical protein